MLEKLKELALRYEDLQAQLADPSVYGDAERLKTVNRELKDLTPVAEAYQAYRQAEADRAAAEELLSDPEMRELAQEELTAAREEMERLKTVNRELKDLTPVAEAYQAYRQAEADRAAAEELLSDPEMRELAQEELTAAREEMERLRQELKLLLLPKDPNDRKNVILEIRAGTGGEEAALFAASLLRMYTMYAAARGWRTDTVELNETELGGVKECSVLIEGEGAWSRLKFESGVHRVQRVPVTESNGRIQTSAATVAVLPEAEGVDVKLDPADIEMQVYRASGAGGQHVNKTSSAVRLIHRPTGLVVECQQERSQFQNRDKAMRLLASRLYEIEREKQDADIARERKSQVGSGDRSEKIRTYNFPQGRVTDHRIGLTLYRIDAVLDGELDELIDALVTADQAEKLKNGGGEP